MRGRGCDAGMVREGFAGAFGLLERARGRTGSWIRSWKVVSEKRTRTQMERTNREGSFSANRATPRHLLREELILARSEIVAAMKRAPRKCRKGLRSLTSLLSVRAAQGTSPGTTPNLDCP